LYFFTVCTETRRPLLDSEISFRILSDIWRQAGERNGWVVGRFLLMPDHVHFFARSTTDALSRGAWHKLWKSLSARKIREMMSIDPPVWQADTFDHILRSDDSYSRKWDYVRENPVRAGLVAHTDLWPWQGEICSLAF
jgi:REP element-mobilizing transposase RayT